MKNVTIDTYNRLANKLSYDTSDKFWAEGISWYPNATKRVINWMHRMRPLNLPWWTACTIFSAASANTSWESNEKAATNALMGKGLPTVVAATRKAVDGIDPLKWNSKTYCFRANLMENYSFVAVDRHMFRIAELKPNEGNKEIIQFCVERLAREYNLTPAEMQAVLWVYNKRG